MNHSTTDDSKDAHCEKLSNSNISF